MTQEQPKPERGQLHIKLPVDLLKRLDHWAIDQDMFRVEAVESLLTLALDQLAPVRVQAVKE